MPQPSPQTFIYTPPTEPWIDPVAVDDDIVVLNKPSGLLSVAGRDPALADCLQARVRERFPTATMVHRLDKDTSGIVVMARHKGALAHIGQQFEKRETEKRYIARVWGEVREEEGLIDLPLGVDWANKPRQRVDRETGRPAQTRYRVTGREGGITRLELVPLTGRTHQLRVHLLAIGHPILGDAFYAEGEVLAAADRLQLHAQMLGFRHPADGSMRGYSAPCPF
ncbi:RNA pseudouridine synthase [Arsenicitalea aurantiaca]|uniref:Dual-specificity RNA pseudouridine synthase RluA n=2 Tax=Arsenicitalea aurantiaca TaxID=1783274 RepID=A0A433X8L5_9HYPH|nr:RNA pseudouridine synthase [Arsenicitalea aurantiaca]